MSDSQPLITTKLGNVKGKIDFASNGQQFYTFHNIPYAEAPIGELRFKAPRPPKPWNGTLDGTIEADECYSMHQVLQRPVGSEDCLKLNVYTRAIQDVKKPVMVWIHGGGFTSGSSKTESYGPNFFMNEDIVLVTINYRLGIFGFLSLKDKSLEVPGNAGLKDQVMALKWVQQNISCFGGDPNNVTIFGESAGSASVHYLICSPMAKGLFHKAILQSGSALNPWARGHGLPDGILEYFNLKGKTEKEILEKLMATTKEELLKAHGKCIDLFRVSDIRPFSPVIEGFNDREPSFLVDDIITIMSSGNYNKVPAIIGYNSHEGMLADMIESKSKLNMMITNFDHAIPFFYNLSQQSETRKQIGDKIRQFYYGNNDPGKSESRIYFRDLSTDNFFLRGIYLTLKYMIASNPHPIYFYRFSVDTELNGCKHLSHITDPGTCHGDDIFYMFKTMITPDIDPESLQGKTMKRFITFWTNFAKTGDPNPKVKDEVFPVEWPRASGNNLIHISDVLEVIDMPENQRMAFWDKIEAIMQNKL